MNRIVLIGNGFDLAHGLKTRYEDFINWYWDERTRGFVGNFTDTSEDCLCKFKDLTGTAWNVNSFNGLKVGDVSGTNVVKYIIEKKELYKTTFSPFFENICKSIETKGWVDVENEYYALLTKYALNGYAEKSLTELNGQLRYIQNLLIKYLIQNEGKGLNAIKSIQTKIYSPIEQTDISVEGSINLKKYIDWWSGRDRSTWETKLWQYGISDKGYIYDIDSYKKGQKEKYPQLFMLPDSIMLLSFNYTHTAQLYLKDKPIFDVNYIHGKTDTPESVIFGYGDELDNSYKELVNTNNNECLHNIKSIKYLESDNYRKILSFIESAPFQVYIMGHSCGNSDRTLLNTLFEHKNCISVKPYYYIREDGTDNYLELVQNISRNFTDMKLMRDRVVNKTYCEPLLK